MASLVKDGTSLQALIDATAGGLTSSTLAELIRAGHAEAVLGQPESDWLEVKREHYALESSYGKVRLAQTVAQFANSEGPGVIVIGIETKKRNGVDILEKLTPMCINHKTTQKYTDILKDRLYPRIKGLSMEQVYVKGGELVLIEVPPQPEELKPFLVHGSVIDGKVRDNYFSIVERSRDGGYFNHPANVHSMLSVGRAFLRFGIYPSE
ncbi:AlbA family DNA-binding domain-containing protein [Enteractinococcus helveticum]|uniref:Schlafen AlbA-2 domain-containing protein n=1 Tax=Enteractinococcus helveticum TaxID=1837282 RepID=A0A1B7M2T6_9MICC|nr:ATP-binding protein [Enteractinococcus helveticum]OAV62885.1 hypothetical protein A6F49_04305 [Enteractinococcus helveticum]